MSTSMLHNIMRLSDTDNVKTIEDLLEGILRLPQIITSLITEAILLIVHMILFIGILLIMWGALEWLSGWNEISGKKNVIRGVALLLLASALGIYL